MIGTAGILMRNTLILTQQVTDNLATGQTARDAAVHRARPVLLTALPAMLAFVLIGGVGVGTELTLLFVSALYMQIFSRKLTCATR